MTKFLIILSILTLYQSDDTKWRFIEVSIEKPTAIIDVLHEKDTIFVEIERKEDWIKGEIMNLTKDTQIITNVGQDYLDNIRTEIMVDSNWILFQRANTCGVDCGNSYFQTLLPNNHFLPFKFPTPPRGEEVVSLRFAVKVSGKYIYSNSIKIKVKKENIETAKLDQDLFCLEGIFAKTIAAADKYYSDKQYQKALELYKRGLIIYPESKYLKNQIDNCKKEIESIPSNY
ncbi:MAG: hypothetical protein R2799_04855 [Crocinitomicaceae bacterium]